MEAVRRMRYFAGVDSMVLHCDDKAAYFRKLDVLESLTGKKKVIFYDADLWLVDRANLSELPNEFCGVHDFGTFKEVNFPFRDCERHGMPKELYVNTGLFVFTPSEHRHVFTLARFLAKQSAEGRIPKMDDFGEQSFINLALHRAGVIPHLLPFAWNFFDFAVDHGLGTRPDRIIGYHAAGVALPKKLKHLQERTAPLPCQPSK